MATVKIHERTKFETSLNLEDGEGIIFIKPPKPALITMTANKKLDEKTVSSTIVRTCDKMHF